MGPFDPDTLMMQPPIQTQAPVLRRLSERSEESSKSRRTDDEEHGDSLQPPKRRAYHNQVAAAPLSSRKHQPKQPWSCKSCSYQNVDSSITCAVCGAGHQTTPAKTPTPVNQGISQHQSFASSFAGDIASIDSSSKEPSIDTASTTKPSKNLDSFLKRKSDGSARRGSSDSDSQASASTVGVSNRTEDQFWRLRKSDKKPGPIVEETTQDDRSLEEANSSSSSSRFTRNEGSHGGFQPSTPGIQSRVVIRTQGSDGGFQPPPSRGGSAQQPRVIRTQGSDGGFQPPPSRGGSSAQQQQQFVRNQGSHGGFQPPTPAVSSRGSPRLPEPDDEGGSDGLIRNSPRLHEPDDEGGSNGLMRQSESITRGYQPPQSLSNTSHVPERASPELKPRSGGSSGRCQPPRHGSSVGDEPQMLSARHHSVGEPPAPTLSSPSMLHSQYRSSIAEITFSPSGEEGSYSQDSGSMSYEQCVDPLTTTSSAITDSSSHSRTLDRGGTRSIPTGDPDDYRSSSEVSTFADENSTASVAKVYLSRKTLTLLSIFCILAIAVSAVVAIALTENSKSTSPLTAEEPDPGPIAVVTAPPTDPPTPRPTQPPTPSPTNAPTPPPTSRPTSRPIGMQDEMTRLGQAVTGHNAGDQLGRFVQLAGAGTIMAVSSGSGKIRLYKYEMQRSGWFAIWQYDTPTSAFGAPLIALGSDDGNVLAVLVDGFVRTYGPGETGEWEELHDPIPTGTKATEGASIALSADGSILAVATPDDGTGRGGEVCAFSYGPSPMGTNSIWNKLGGPVLGYSNQTGFDIDLSDDGTKLVVASWRQSRDPNTQLQTVSHRHVRAHKLEDRQTWHSYGERLEVVGTPDRKSTASLSISGDGYTMAACTPAECNVYAFDVVGEKWVRIGNELAGGDAVSLSSSGDVVVIGMTSAGARGAVQVYENRKRTFSSLGGSITGENLGDNTGEAVSISGSVFAVGSPLSDSAAANAGSVQVYSLQ